eukprot:scaffold98734_cov97-Phaeocystis_antarctica.AAC.1
MLRLTSTQKGGDKEGVMTMWLFGRWYWAERLPRTSMAPLEGCTHIDRARGTSYGGACNPPEEPSMCVEVSQPSTYHRPKSPHRSSPLLYHPLFEAVATRGQSQHSDRPRVCGADAVGDCVVPQSDLAAIAAVVHGDVGDLGRRRRLRPPCRGLG